MVLFWFLLVSCRICVMWCWVMLLRLSVLEVVVVLVLSSEWMSLLLIFCLVRVIVFLMRFCSLWMLLGKL